MAIATIRDCLLEFDIFGSPQAVIDAPEREITLKARVEGASSKTLEHPHIAVGG
jgi:hypothetical protein